MNQTPPISPVVKLKLKEIDDKKLLLVNNSLNTASSKLQSILDDRPKDKTGPITLSKPDREEPISDVLSELISQLIPLHKSTLVLLSNDSISHIISVLNLTVTILQNQENLLNLLRLNQDIVKDQFDVEKEILIRELDVLRTLRESQIRRRASEPSTKLKRRKLRVSRPRSTAEEAVESDRTISDDEEKNHVPTRNVSTISNPDIEYDKDLEYDRLIEEIGKNQKLFLHNKFGYYYNTLNDGRGGSKRKRSFVKK